MLIGRVIGPFLGPPLWKILSIQIEIFRGKGRVSHDSICINHNDLLGYLAIYDEPIRLMFRPFDTLTSLRLCKALRANGIK